MRPQPVEDCYRHIINSKAIFLALLEKVKTWDYDLQNKLVAENNLEKLEMYTIEHLMGIR